MTLGGTTTPPRVVHCSRNTKKYIDIHSKGYIMGCIKYRKGIENKMTIAPKKKGRPSNRPSDEELAMLYSGMTAKELAEHYGVAVSTVKSWIASIRKKGESNEGK